MLRHSGVMILFCSRKASALFQFEPIAAPIGASRCFGKAAYDWQGFDDLSPDGLRKFPWLAIDSITQEDSWKDRVFADHPTLYGQGLHPTGSSLRSKECSLFSATSGQ
jgi:hypothetical protein